jgi:CheY-like chemotaxis protein
MSASNPGKSSEAERKRRVLVVDDEPDIVQLVEMSLASENLEVAAAMDGAEALEKLRQYNPDAVLLDVVLPGLDGFEVCRRIRCDPNASGTCIIFFTAAREKYLINRISESGADACIHKNEDDPLAIGRKVKELLGLA